MSPSPPQCLPSLFALIVALLFTACSSEPGAEDATYANAPVILISVDTLRSDRLPAYGHTAVDTPALDAFRADSILFKHAYSHYPLTLPSHTSMLTGLLPSQHGVRDNVGYPVDAENLPYLPRLLDAAGYATGGAVSAFVLNGDHGLDAGFDFYDDAIETRKDTPLGGLQRSGMETLDRALAWLDGAGDEPPFLFFHIYEPHTPYTAPAPYSSRYSDPYDAEVAYTDAIMGRLFDALRERGLYDSAIILFVSDHGEGLGDHGEQEHGIFLYRESIQVPMLLKLPGGARGGESVSAAAQLIDLAPTILSLLGLPVPDEMGGGSLLALASGKAEGGDRPIYAETYYPRLHMGWNELTSLIQGGHHYIEGPDPELYDLREDPAETRNILREERRTFAALRDALQLLEAPLTGPGDVDAETMSKLAALGYTGGATVVTDEVLPDPKAQIGALEDLKRATRLMGKKQWAEAVPILQAMVAENPRMQDGWEKLALALDRAGRRTEAVAAYQKALENSGGSAQVALSLAGLYLELGNLEEAQRHAELAVATSPLLAHTNLSEIALAGDDLESAEKHAQQAIGEDADRPHPRIMLARVLIRKGDLDEAGKSLAAAERILAETGDNPPAGFLLARGDLAARRGNGAAARRDFEEEIRVNPEILDTYARLAVLEVSEGRAQEAWKTLQQLVQANNNSPAAYAVAVDTLRILGDGATANRLLAHARGLYPQDRRLEELAGS